MKKLFSRLSSARSFAKIFSMDAQLEKRTRVIFFAVLALLGIVSLGAFVFPHVGHAQECVWDCDLGSDVLDSPWSNSPGFSIEYCFDQSCVAGLQDSKGKQIFSVNIPTAKVTQNLNPNPCSSGQTTVTITGTVVALLTDKFGNVNPLSRAEALLNVVVLNADCSAGGSPPSSTLSKTVGPNVDPATVFDPVNSFIKIQAHSNQPSLDSPKGWKTAGCPTNSDGTLSADCTFPLGIVLFKNNSTLQTNLPQTDEFGSGQVYRAVESSRFVGMRMCKGTANGDASTIACSVGGSVAVGGGVSDAVFFWPNGNYSGATNHTINPTKGSNPYDIATIPAGLFANILVPPAVDLGNNPATVTATASPIVGGVLMTEPPQTATNCNVLFSQSVVRCFFKARDLLPHGCDSGTPVILHVRGLVLSVDGTRDVKFDSTDPQLICQ